MRLESASVRPFSGLASYCACTTKLLWSASRSLTRRGYFTSPQTRSLDSPRHALKLCACAVTRALILVRRLWRQMVQSSSVCAGVCCGASSGSTCFTVVCGLMWYLILELPASLIHRLLFPLHDTSATAIGGMFVFCVRGSLLRTFLPTKDLRYRILFHVRVLSHAGPGRIALH